MIGTRLASQAANANCAAASAESPDSRKVRTLTLTSALRVWKYGGACELSQLLAYTGAESD